MMRLSVPVRAHDKHNWGMLSYFGNAHDFCGETVSLVNQNYSFIGGHRVRRYKFKKNVAWQISAGTDLDITSVSPGASPPRRRRGRRRSN